VPEDRSSSSRRAASDLIWEQRARERSRLRRRRRLRRLGFLGGALTVLIAVLVVVLSGGRGGTKGQRDGGHRAAADVVLPRGGRTVLPGHLIVAYYGIIGTTNVLGRGHDPDADARGVERQARAYAHFGLPVQPAFELVTTVASSHPGPDGTYSSPIDPVMLRRYLNAAHRHKLLLILDFQPGRGEFFRQVERYESFLLDPSVGVALDPEWKITSGEVPDQVIGSSSAASINAVSSYLSRLVEAHRLPQKLFIVHEFRLGELPDRQKIQTRPGLATVLQMDGLGTVAGKLGAYRQVQHLAGRFFPGFKIFLRRVDDPVRLTPQRIMALRPQPRYISYQ
jgi:hypothetical protein